jgi:predicted XRE-type DNA-binding protein
MLPTVHREVAPQSEQMPRINKNKGDFIQSTGNVFSDLDLENADELLVKADLMHTINREIQRRGLTPQEAAELVGTTQSDILSIARGKGDRYSQGDLLDVLRRLAPDSGTA